MIKNKNGGNMKRKIDCLIIIMIILLLFAISSCITIGSITQPKFLGIFFVSYGLIGLLSYLIIYVHGFIGLKNSTRVYEFHYASIIAYIYRRENYGRK